MLFGSILLVFITRLIFWLGFTPAGATCNGLYLQARRLQEKGWQPRWFRKDEDDSYCYLGGYWEAREKGNWDGIPHIFGQSSALTG
uniref:Uncharacterized protein n=1 Tax=Aegilops tauschii subsp. strangulata TaxID=200361 RepID=A0A453K579_AEGTS